MKIKIILLSLLFAATTINAQKKYLIYFKDKGPVSLSKSSRLYSDIINNLSGEAIERRKKVMGNDFIDHKDIPVGKDYIDKLRYTGAEIVWELKWLNAVSAYIENDKLETVKKLPFVSEIKSVGIFKQKPVIFNDFDPEKTNKLQSVENQNYGASLTQMELSDVPLLHNHNINGNGVTIAVLDAGFRFNNHNALNNIEIIATRDFVYGDDDVSNENDVSHGTSVMSLIAGYEEGQLISPAFNASLILAKTENINVEVNLEEDNFAAAVEWVEALGADIITSSLGYSEFDPGQRSYTYEEMDGETTIVTKAMETAFSRGVVTITSAGNEGNDPWRYITAPGDGENVITVGAVNGLNVLTSFSSRGPTSDGRIKPEVLAQGTNCYAAVSSNAAYNFVQGTSFSAPIVAGITAQLMSVYPHLNNKQVREIIIRSGDNYSDPDNDRGYGLLSAKRAVEYPNIKADGDRYIINKIFLPAEDVDPASVKIIIDDGTDTLIDNLMSYDNDLKYNYVLNSYTTGMHLKFNFEYKDLSGNEYSVPHGMKYTYIYGESTIDISDENEIIEIPENYKLEQNFPNPFNPFTTIYFELPQKSRVKIIVYDVLGQYVATLVDEVRRAGYYHDVKWYGRDAEGKTVSSGAYIYQMISDSYISAKKMIYIK
ncbi:MAG: S8 family serine peptidase [Melioribacteraceae bacterium]|nr:S8 family serine peptidase [Melioribacteraceae bacterium]